MKELLSLAKRKAQEAEVFLTTHEETPVIFEANRLKQLQTTQRTTVGLRLVNDGRIGFASSTSLEDGETLVDKAVAVSQFGAEARFELPPRSTYPSVEVYDPAVEAVSMEEMIALGEEVIARVREHTPEVICEASVDKSIASVHLLNSRGGEASYRESFFSISIEGTLVRGTDMLFVGDSDTSCHPIKETHELVETVKQQLEWAKREASVSTARLPVIFTPRGVAGALLLPLITAFNGKTVLQGASPLQHRQGEKVFDERFSLYDDATLAFRPRSRPCDDEGVPSQRTPLVEKGVIHSFLYDLQTAGLAGTRSTGNGERGGGGQPTPGASTLVVEAGDTAFDDMVREMKEGLIVEQLMGAGQTNVLGGEFSGNILLGYKVERGEIVGRVKDAVISGNVHEVLADLVAISREARWVRGMIHLPALYCANLSVASKK